MPQLIETEEEWLARNGGRESGVRLPDTDSVIFPTGGCAKDRQGYFEPPQDPWESLRLRRLRASELHRRAAEQYEKTRSGLLQLAAMSARYNNYAPPDDRDLAALRELKAKAAQLAEELRLLDEEWQQSPDAKFRKQLAAEAAARQEAARAAEQAILNI